MPITQFLSRWRDRAAWSDPHRKVLTLESFSKTEEDGGRDLLAAARRVSDPDLRGHIERHAADEMRHAELFRERARATRAELHLADPDSDRPDRPYDLSRGRRGLEQDAHGFFNAGLYDELGEVEYVAMLHVAESRAEQLFAHHRALVSDDPACAAMFEEILKDEKYHMAYTKRFLERWERQGRAGEVKRALRAARSSRALDAWKRLGVRSAAGFGRVVLWVSYWTFVVPFGLATRNRERATGFREPAVRANPLDGQA